LIIRLKLSVQKEKEPRFIGNGQGLTAASCSSYVKFGAFVIDHQQQDAATSESVYTL